MVPGPLTGPGRSYLHGPPPRRDFFRRRGRTFQELARGPPPPVKKTPVRASRRALAARAVAREVTGSGRQGCGCWAWRAPLQRSGQRSAARSVLSGGPAERSPAEREPRGRQAVAWWFPRGGAGAAGAARHVLTAHAVGNAGRDFPRSGNRRGEPSASIRKRHRASERVFLPSSKREEEKKSPQRDRGTVCPSSDERSRVSQPAARSRRIARGKNAAKDGGEPS
jgi:hypothetical protein